MNHATRIKKAHATSIFLFRERQCPLPNERRKRRLDREMVPVAWKYSTANGQKSRGRQNGGPCLLIFLNR